MWALIFMTCCVMMMTSPGHVSSAPCDAITASVNCSFEGSEPCTKAYTSRDKHGLMWSRGAGEIKIPINDRYNNRYGQRYTSILESAGQRYSYMYVRGTEDSRTWNLWTDLVSPTFTIFGGCLQYFYHNNVCGNSSDTDLKKLKVILRPQEVKGQKSDIILRDYSCVDDPKWYRDQIPLSDLAGTYRLVFSAQHHGWTNQTVAVDHVIYMYQSCSLRDDPSFDYGDCDWERGDMCGYQHSTSKPNGLSWDIREQTELLIGMTQLSSLFGSTRRGGILMVSGDGARSVDDGLESPTVSGSGSYSDNSSTGEELVSVTVRSPQITVEQEGCLVVNYYSGRHDTDNNDVTALVLTRSKHGDETSTTLSMFPSTLGKQWLTQHVPLPKGRYAMMFTAQLLLPYGQLPQDFIAIDDVELFQKTCEYIQCQPRVAPSNVCNGKGHRIGLGIKQNTCDCTLNYIWNACQFTVPFERNKGFATQNQNRQYRG